MLFCFVELCAYNNRIPQEIVYILIGNANLVYFHWKVASKFMAFSAVLEDSLLSMSVFQ